MWFCLIDTVNRFITFGEDEPCPSIACCINRRSAALAVSTVNCLCRKNWWPYSCHPSYKRHHVSLIVKKIWQISLFLMAKHFKKDEEDKSNWTNALKWKIWSFHLPPLLFAHLLLQSWSAEEQMFSQTWRRGASVLMGMALPPLAADASTWQLLDFMELLRSH